MNKNIALIVVGLPVEGPFDYAVDPAQREVLQVGMRVRVMFNRRRRVGYVVGFREQSTVKRLNTVIGPLESRPSAGAAMLEWTRRAAAYYGCSWGEMLELAYPGTLRRGKYVDVPAAVAASDAEACPDRDLVTGFQLSPRHNKEWMGPVTSALHAGRAVLIIVPDKFYAGYFAEQIGPDLGCPVFLLDKRQKAQEQLQTFQDLCSGRPAVIVGTRSAVFVPHPRVGHILIVHEEHDWHKSEQSPHYRTGRIALLRAQAEGGRVTFLTLNPRLELYQEARTSGWRIRQAADVEHAKVQLVDLNNYTPGKSSILSFPVQNLMRETLEAGGKLLLYFNRKGFMTFTRCQQCGHAVKCPRCDVHLVLRHKPGKLTCHSCGFTREPPQKCPECGWPYMRSTGMGIEKLESEVHRYFPTARTSVLDKDTQALPRSAPIVLATSAIFKFQANYRADHIIMLDYDQAFHHPDFRSAQRCLTTLLMLRSMAKQKLVVQTRMPDDPAIRAARDGTLEAFWTQELETRQELRLPPYVSAANIVVRAVDEEKAWTTAAAIHAAVPGEAGAEVEADEPFPAMRPKLRDQYWCNIMLKSPDHSTLMDTVNRILQKFRSARQVTITVDVDP